jgi:hypothetical protein
MKIRVYMTTAKYIININTKKLTFQTPAVDPLFLIRKMLRSWFSL